MWAIALSCLPVLAAAGNAAAQPAPPPGEPAALPPPPPPTVVTAPAPIEPPADADRPSGLTFAIGLGYALPTSLQTPNITSVRARLASGLTIEPQLAIATSSTSLDTGMTQTNRQTELTLGALARLPFKARGKVDLELVGSAAISTRLINPDGDDNNQTITTLGIGYGVAVAYWFTAHWNLSLTATNPLISYLRNRTESPTAVTVASSTTVGLIFDPQVALMVHLYN